MNITNFNNLKPTKDRLLEMLELQKELQKLYEMPESLDLSIAKDQDLLRWLAWCVTEETGEAMECYNNGMGDEHLLDEVADSTHFFLELINLSGLRLKFTNQIGIFDSLYLIFTKDMKNPLEAHSEFICALALAINVLKNRKWRKINLLTNEDVFYKKLETAVELFFVFLKSLNITDNLLWSAFTRKYQVNKFRRESNY